MWKVLSATPNYLICFLEENSGNYYVGISNLQKYWNIYISRSEFLHNLKQSNEGIEFDDDNDLLERGVDMLKNSETLKSVSVTQDKEKNILNITFKKSFEITLKLELSFMEATSEIMFEMVLQPMIQTICDLRDSQSELRNLLLQKDREIEEYKIEGKAPRRLITTVYDDAAHMSKHTCYERFFGAPNVPEIFKILAHRCSNKRINQPLPVPVNNSSKLIPKEEKSTEINGPKKDIVNSISPSTSRHNIENTGVKLELHNFSKPEISNENTANEISVNSVFVSNIGEVKQEFDTENNETQIKLSNSAEKSDKVTFPVKKRPKMKLNY